MKSANPFGYFIKGIKNYVTFSGRATRPEYWYFRLFEAIFSFVIVITDYKFGIILPGIVFSLLIFLPGIAVGMRRLHDTDRSGWWMWLPLASFSLICIYILFLYQLDPSGAHLSPLVFLPIIPFLLCPIVITLIFLCQPGTPGNNRFGPPPGNGRG